MSKNYFGVKDYRNCKYQGSLKDGKKSGIGMLIDDAIRLCISEW